MTFQKLVSLALPATEASPSGPSEGKCGTFSPLPLVHMQADCGWGSSLLSLHPFVGQEPRALMKPIPGAAIAA